ncbi:MAG: sugar phosphate isomerase/epimerase, partial [Clostridia bacterium]|nr:sugar phosphate isomerase/epimerase [Clostridia bacterium]
MRKSINAWSIDSALGMETMFEAVHGAGFDGLELNVDKPDHSAHSLSASTTAEELARIKALSARFGLPVVSVSSSLWGKKMCADGTLARREARDLLMRQLDCAAALGAKGILVVPGGIGEDMSIQKAYGLCRETLAGMRADIEAAGLFVGVENVWNGFFQSPFDMASFIDDLACPLIGAYYDVGNVAAFSWTEHWIEILGRRIGLVHIKDFKRNRGIHSGGAFVDLLRGDIAWPKVVAALQNAGFDGYLTAEVFLEDPATAYPD